MSAFNWREFLFSSKYILIQNPIMSTIITKIAISTVKVRGLNALRKSF